MAENAELLYGVKLVCPTNPAKRLSPRKNPKHYAPLNRNLSGIGVALTVASCCEKTATMSAGGEDTSTLFYVNMRLGIFFGPQRQSIGLAIAKLGQGECAVVRSVLI